MTNPRIVSLVPSLTELLIDLGLETQLVGRTRFCIHPEEIVSGIPIIGGTKNPNIEKILSFKPDIIIANKEENRKEDVEVLQNHADVMITEIDSISDALECITDVGRRFEKETEANLLVSKINNELDQPPDLTQLSTAYYIWKDPWISVGGDTYIHDVMQRFGLQNVLDDLTRYPELSLEHLQKYNPELILLSSEPFPFKEQHQKEIQELFPNSKVQLIDGEWFSWYGSRMLPAFRGLREWRNELNF